MPALRIFLISTLLLVTCSASFLAFAVELPKLDDPEVQACVERTAVGKSLKQHIALRSYDSSGLIEESIADIYLARPDGEKSRAVIRLSAPPSRAGLAVLMVETDSVDPKMYLYVPDLKRTRRVTGKQLASSMMGTDFSYEEFSYFQRSAAEMTTNRIADDSVDGILSYVLESIPSSADSPYKRILTFIDQQRCVPLKTQFLGEGDSVSKELVTSSESIKEIDGRHVPHEVIMYDRIKETRTELLIDSLELDIELNENIFSPKRLGVKP